MKALVILLFAGLAVTAADLPDGHGKDELVRRCSKCHSPDTVAEHRQTQEDWELTLEKMASFGAEATDDEYNAIVEYLVKNFGPQSAKINVNKAAAKEIENGWGFRQGGGDCAVPDGERGLQVAGRFEEGA
jgi:hypothetical protein